MFVNCLAKRRPDGSGTRVALLMATWFLCPRLAHILWLLSQLRRDLSARADERFRSESPAFRLHQVPGFAILEITAFVRFRPQANGLAIGNDLDRENVPDVLGEVVSDEKVDVLFGIFSRKSACRSHAATIPGWQHGENRFDLHAPKDLSKADDNVVAVAVSPGLGDGKAKAGGLAHEGKLSEFATLFWIEFGRLKQFVDTPIFGFAQICPPKIRKRGHKAALFFLPSISSMAG